MENRPKILIIEDDEEFMHLETLILTSRGFDVVGAQRGGQGLDLIRAERPDLILLDLMLPDISGWELHRRLLADDEIKDIPVIVTTARKRIEGQAVQSQIDQVAGYLTKPYAIPVLLDTIHRVLEG